MADKYALTGNWSAASTWSLTDGGAGGAGQPTAVENAYFSNLSGNIVQDTAAAVCLDLDFTKGTGYTGTFSGSAAMAISGSLTLNGAMTRTYTGAITFNATSSKTIKSNGISLNQNITWNGVGGEWVFQDTFNNVAISNNNFLTAGTLNLNGQSVTCGFPSGNGMTINGAGTKSIVFGGGTLTTGSWNYSGSNFTTSGSGTLTVGRGAFAGGAASYPALNIFTTAGVTLAISGAWTCTGLTISGDANKLNVISLAANITVTGTFQYLGNSEVNALLIQSSVVGTPRTITAAAIDAASDFCHFMDITAAGAAAPFATGTRLGDCGGNTNITTTTPATQTATGTASFTWSTHGWTSRVPLPQDDVVIPNAFIANQIITADMPRLGRDITCTCTGSPRISQIVVSVFGSLTLASGMTFIGGSTFTLAGRGTHTITMAGATSPGGMTGNAFGGTYTMNDALTVGSVFSWVNGTLNSAGFTVSAREFSLQGGTINPGASWWVASGAVATAWGMSVACTFNAGTSTIEVPNTVATRSFVGAGKTYYNLWFRNTSSGTTLDVSNANTFNQIKVDPGLTVRFNAGVTNTAADFDIGVGCTIGSITAANHTLAKSGGGKVKLQGVTVSRSTASPTTTFYAFNGSTDGGNNVNWNFYDPDYSLSCAAGSFVLTEQAAGLRAGRRLAAGAGSFALSGQDVRFLRGYRLVAEAATFALGGQSAGLLRGYRLACAAGAFVFAGQDAVLTFTPILRVPEDPTLPCWLARAESTTWYAPARPTTWYATK